MSPRVRRPHDWSSRRPRLTRAQIAAMRALRAKDVAYKVLAIDFGVSVTHAWRVCQWR